MEENKRWIVTYTKHIRQKKKVYQDGVLEHHYSSNKILLYDDSGKLLDSRYLKKDDLAECGVTLAFESHLVDIGNLDETHKPLEDFKVSGSDGRSNKKAKMYGKNSANSFPVKKSQLDRHGPTNVYLHDMQVTKRGNKWSELQTSSKVHNQPNSKPSAIREWDVLYTNQITQKAKRYHDGILKLLSCGSHTNQLVLLKEDGTILSSKFQRSAECLSIGNTYEMPNYLVEICHQRHLQGVADKNNEFHGSIQKDSLPSTMTDNIKGLEEPKKNPSDKEVVIRSSEVGSFAKAFQILSSLRRPPQQILVPENLLADSACQSMDLFHSDLQGIGGALKSVILPEAPSDATKLVNPNCEVEMATSNHSAPSSLLYVEEACKTSVTNLGVKSTGKDSLDLETSSIVCETSDTANGSSRRICIKESLGSHTEKPKLGCMGLQNNRLQIEEQGNNAMSSQHVHLDDDNSKNEGFKGVHSSSASSFACITAFPSINDNEKASELKTSPGKAAITDELPSFDLGIQL